MILSKTHQFVFIHIFKTAGTSVKRAIRRYAMPAWQEHANSILKRVGVPQFGPHQFGDHTTAGELIETINLREFRRLFSFAFVRNPWDWERSHYRYICRQPKHHEFDVVSSLAGFSDYVRWRCDGRFQLQESFLLYEDTQVVDFVGRFENLESDYKYVCKKIGIESRLPRLNRSHKSAGYEIHGYRKHYDNVSRDLIKETYQADIARFGYRF